MTHAQFFRLLDDLLELDAGTFKSDTVLASIPQWDSLALIGFIALLDQHFGLSVPAVKILECRTAGDLAKLAGDKIAG